MKQLFYIDNKAGAAEQINLALQIGERDLRFAITDETGTELFELGYFVSDEVPGNSWNDKELNELFHGHPSLSHPFQKTRVAFDFSNELVLPDLEQQPAENMDGLVAQTLIKQYPNAKFHSYHALLINKIKKSNESDCFLLDFRKNDFTIIALRAKQFLLAQNFEYDQPADVLYYLLKTCRVLAFNQETADISISGLVDKQSSLYRELYQYFANISFREANWEGNLGYPLHFFTSLNDLAICE